MTTIGIDQRSARSYWTISRDNSERAFRSARRHSALVRFLRIALPFLIGLVAVGITLKTYLNPLLNPLPIQAGKVVLSGSKITMDHPRIAGFTSDARPYALTAETAVQDLKKPDAIELHSVKANVQMQDLGKVQLTAPLGFYDTKKEILKLDQNILITSSKGYKGRLQEATVDIRSGHVVSDRPVAMEMLQGTLDANRMEIFNSGALMRFDHGVRMTLKQALSQPSKKQASAASATDSHEVLAPTPLSQKPAPSANASLVVRPPTMPAQSQKSIPPANAANRHQALVPPQPSTKLPPSDRSPVQTAGPAPLPQPAKAALSTLPSVRYVILRRFPPLDPRRLAPSRPVAAAKIMLIQLPKRRP